MNLNHLSQANRDFKRCDNKVDKDYWLQSLHILILNQLINLMKEPKYFESTNKKDVYKNFGFTSSMIYVSMSLPFLQTEQFTWFIIGLLLYYNYYITVGENGYLLVSHY